MNASRVCRLVVCFAVASVAIGLGSSRVMSAEDMDSVQGGICYYCEDIKNCPASCTHSTSKYVECATSTRDTDTCSENSEQPCGTNTTPCGGHHNATGVGC